MEIVASAILLLLICGAGILGALKYRRKRAALEKHKRYTADIQRRLEVERDPVKRQKLQLRLINKKEP